MVQQVLNWLDGAVPAVHFEVGIRACFGGSGRASSGHADLTRIFLNKHLTGSKAPEPLLKPRLPDELPKWHKDRIAKVVRYYAKEELAGKPIWEETERERKALPGAFVDGQGLHVDSLLLDVLGPEDDDYLAFIIEHELGHFRLGHLLKTKRTREDEIEASADAANALKRAGVLSSERIDSLAMSWGGDALTKKPSLLIDELKFRVKIVLLPWVRVFKTYHYRSDRLWINISQGENYVLNYLIQHPAVVAPGLSLGGVEVYLGEGMRANMILLSADRDYFVVEAKNAYVRSKLGTVASQVRRYARALVMHLEKEGIATRRVIPVVCAIEYGNKTGYLLKESFSREQIEGFLNQDPQIPRPTSGSRG